MLHCMMPHGEGAVVGVQVPVAGVDGDDVGAEVGRISLAAFFSGSANGAAFQAVG